MNIDYLAGFFDGEGCITIMRRGSASKPAFPRIVISSNCVEIIEMIRESLKVKGFLSLPNRHRSTFQLNISSSKEVIYVATLLLPHLFLKREVMEAGLQLAQRIESKVGRLRGGFTSEETFERERLVYIIRACNARHGRLK